MSIVTHVSLFAKIKEGKPPIYNFFRTVDNIVDNIPYPQNHNLFNKFKNQYYAILNNRKISKSDKYTEIISKYIYFHRKYSFDDIWVDNFFKSMEKDINSPSCNTLSELYLYIRGSSDFIGGVYCRFFNLSIDAEKYAIWFSRGVAIFEMVCDFAEDVKINRVHLPLGDIRFEHLSDQKLEKNYTKIIMLLRKYLNLSLEWIDMSKKIIEHLPLVPRAFFVANAEIQESRIHYVYANPLIVYQKNILKDKKYLFKRRLHFNYLFFINIVLLLFVKKKSAENK